MSANPDLDIPSLLNPALRQPHQFGGRDQPRDKNQQAVKKDDGASPSTQDCGDKLSKSVRNLNSLQGIQSLARMVSNRCFGSTADYLKQVASEFSTLREALPQVAKLNGWPISTPVPPHQTPAPGRNGFKREVWISPHEGFPATFGAGLKVNQQRLNTEQSGQFHHETAEFTRAKEISKPDAATLESGLLDPLNVPPDINRLLDPHVKVFKSREDASAPGSQILPQMNLLDSQTVFPEEAKNLLTSVSRALPGDAGFSIINEIDSRTSTQVAGRGEEVRLNQSMTPTQSTGKGTPRLLDGVTHGDPVDSMLREFASRALEVPGPRGFADGHVNVDRFKRTIDFRSYELINYFKNSNTDEHYSRAVEPTRLIVGAPADRTEWVELSANLKHLRQQAKTLPGRESRFEVPFLPYGKRNTPNTVTETRDRMPVADERGVAPVEQISKSLQSRSFTPGAASPMFDYEIRRILEQGNRLMEAAAKAGTTHLLVSPIPNPRTRM